MSITDLQIRLFEHSDQEIVRQLVLDGLADHFQELDPSLNLDLLDIHCNYLNEGHRFIVSLLDGHIVGCGALVRESLATGRIVRLSVASEFRRIGIGNLIVKYLINEAQQLDLTWLVVETNTDWTPAIRLYDKLGFRENHRDLESIHFTLDLSSSGAADR